MTPIKNKPVGCANSKENPSHFGTIAHHSTGGDESAMNSYAAHSHRRIFMKHHEM
jgi:hypothetical protein